HVARLVPGDGDGTHEIELRTVAVVWQLTGEDWSQVRCRFSTARPARSATPPLLEDDVLRLTRKVDRAVHVEARDVAVATAGLGRGARAVDEMPGVDDGGQPLAYEAPRPAAIPGDGQPYRIDVDELRLRCTAELVVFPELSPVAHHRATATLIGARPLLAGPVRVARGQSMVGRSRLGFVGQGEPFELGFGVHDRVRLPPAPAAASTATARPASPARRSSSARWACSSPPWAPSRAASSSPSACRSPRSRKSRCGSSAPATPRRRPGPAPRRRLKSTTRTASS